MGTRAEAKDGEADRPAASARPSGGGKGALAGGGGAGADVTAVGTRVASSPARGTKGANMNRLMTAAAALLLISASTPALRAQETPFFGEVMDVRVINIEAVVSSGGDRVYGLGRDDFRLLVDKAEVPIEYFEEAGRPGSSPPGNHYLLFIDDYFSIPARRDQAIEKLRNDLVSLRSEDRMAIVAYDGRRLEMLSPPTSDRAALQRVLLEAKQRPAYGLQRRSEASRSLSMARQIHRPSGMSFTGIGYDGAGRAAVLNIDAVEDMYRKVERLSIAAASALRGFQGTDRQGADRQGGDGRKVLLMYSGGMPIAPVNAVYQEYPLHRRIDPFGDARNLYSTLLEAANRLGYTVYPVDLGSTFSGGDLPSAEIGSIYDRDVMRNAHFENQGLNEDVLYQLASATGGLPMFDGARVPIFRKVQEDLGSYYSFGFRPTWRGDDQDHKVEIQVLRKGAKVRTRSGFTDLSRSAQLDLQVESAHLFDAPLPADASFAIHAAPPHPEGAGRMTVEAAFEIPADQISWTRQGADNVAQVEMRIAATDERGNAADVPRQIIELRLPGEIRPGQKAAYDASLKLRRRPHRLLVTLYDPPTGRLLAQKINVTP